MRHVLIADDEERIREVVQYALEKEGFKVTAVADGNEALDASKREQIDLIVLDVTMPGLDGLEVCRRIRAERQTPILFLSREPKRSIESSGWRSAGMTTSPNRSHPASS